MDGLTQATSLVRIVTYTTRPKRPNERAGVDYSFVSSVEFERLVHEEKIAEHVRVYNDYYYGSPSLHYDSSGHDRLVELDPEGRATYAAVHSPHMTSIFLLPPSLGELRRRIEQRHPETNLATRLRMAAEQMRRAGEYDYVVINENLQDLCDTAIAIVRAKQQQLQKDSLVAFALELSRESGENSY